MIQPSQTSRAKPSAKATAQASSEMPRPAAFLATLVVSVLSDTVSPFRLRRRGHNGPDFRGPGGTKKKPDHRYAPMSGLLYFECNYLGGHSERTRTPVIRRATTRRGTIKATDRIAAETACHAADFTGRAGARQVHVVCGRQDLSALRSAASFGTNISCW